MKKVTTLFTTTMIALALMMAAPTAMADPDLEKAKGIHDKNGKTAVKRVARCMIAAATATNPDGSFNSRLNGEAAIYWSIGDCVSDKRSN